MIRAARRTAAFVAPFALAALLVAGTASAVVWRHDTSEARARELAARFTAVGSSRRPGATLTLIEARWALTAAHVAAELGPRDRVMIAGKPREIASVWLHPKSKTPKGSRIPPEVDIGLIELVEPVTEVTPLPLYRGRDEMGKRLVLVGHGDFGAVGAARAKPDGHARAVENEVADAGPLRLFLPFDAPPAGLPLEGIGVAGDSGGPALIEVAGAWQVAGVSSGADGPPGAYGTTDVYARVSSQVGWIDLKIACDRPVPHLYDGPTRPDAETVCVVFGASAGTRLVVEAVDERRVPAGATAFRVLPGKMTFQVRCGQEGHDDDAAVEGRKPILPFSSDELRAGHVISARVIAATAVDEGCSYFWQDDAAPRVRIERR